MVNLEKDLIHILEKRLTAKKENEMKKLQILVIFCLMSMALTCGICVQVKTVNQNGTTVNLTAQQSELKNEISSFGFTLEDLVNEAPKQQATRENAINLSRKISQEEEFVSFMHEKKRLPIKKIVLRFGVTEKVVKRSKKFIISVVIIIDKNLSALKNWIRK